MGVAAALWYKATLSSNELGSSMKEIFVNGVEFRYKSERDLGVILQHARNPARLNFLSRLCSDVARRRAIMNKINEQGRAAPEIIGPLRLNPVPRQSLE